MEIDHVNNFQAKSTPHEEERRVVELLSEVKYAQEGNNTTNLFSYHLQFDIFH